MLTEQKQEWGKAAKLVDEAIAKLGVGTYSLMRSCSKVSPYTCYLHTEERVWIGFGDSILDATRNAFKQVLVHRNGELEKEAEQINGTAK